MATWPSRITIFSEPYWTFPAGGRERYFERRAFSGLARVIDSSLVGGDNLAHDGKPQSTAERLRGAKRLKDLQAFGDPRTRVADLEKNFTFRLITAERKYTS